MNNAEKNYQVIRQVEDARHFLLEMYAHNPVLLKTAEPRIRELFEGRQTITPTPKQRGISLIELIIFIVIISVALTGILLVMNQVTAHSADPLLHKQAIAAAESLLEEIQLQDFVATSGVATAGPVTPTNRTDYHIVGEYNGFPNGGSATGIYDLAGAAIPGLANYGATVSIDSTTSPLGSGATQIAAGSAVRITVTVTDPQGNALAIDGYRTAY
jgi:MSHA pilin protein MshD